MKNIHEEIDKNAKGALCLIFIIFLGAISTSVYLLVNNSPKSELTFILLSLNPTMAIAKNQIKLNKLVQSLKEEIEKNSTEQEDGE